MKKAVTILLTAALVAVATFVGCSREQSSGSETASGELHVYSTVADDLWNPLIGAFNKLYPDIRVYSTYGSAGECKARIQAEATNPQADVMLGGLQFDDIAVYAEYFEDYVSANDGIMPEEYRNTSGKFNFHDTQLPCLVVNDALEESLGIEVTGWESLLDPRLYGRIVTANPAASSSAWNNLQCILTDFGGWNSAEAWDYIAKLMQNGLVVVSSSSIPVRSTFSGEYVVGLTYEPSAIRHLDGGQTGAHIVFPVEGTTSSGFASAIIKGAKNLENAKLFIDFLQSDEGQQAYLDSGARPITPHQLERRTPHMVDLDTINMKVPDLEALGAHRTEIVDMWNEAWARYGTN